MTPKPNRQEHPMNHAAADTFGRPNPPRGFREDPDSGELRCPHRDITCCPACVAEHDEIVATLGVAYWQPDPAVRAEMAGWDAEIEAKHGTPILAEPYTARQCPTCKVWVYTAAGPFAEGDPTKTLADAYHWRDKHETDADRYGDGVVVAIGFPYFSFNSEPVTAMVQAVR